MAFDIAPVPEGMNEDDTALASVIQRAEALHRHGCSMNKDYRRTSAGVKRLLNEKYQRQLFPEPLELTL